MLIKNSSNTLIVLLLLIGDSGVQPTKHDNHTM